MIQTRYIAHCVAGSGMHATYSTAWEFGKSRLAYVTGSLDVSLHTKQSIAARLCSPTYWDTSLARVTDYCEVVVT